MPSVPGLQKAGHQPSGGDDENLPSKEWEWRDLEEEVGSDSVDHENEMR